MRPRKTPHAESTSATAERIGSEYERLLADASRRARGVFYTPTSIVDSIVQETLPPLFEGRSGTEVRQVRILDPACGCGAFLLGAYRWLCRWYARQLGRPLSSARRRSLVAHLAGIDIDSAALQRARQALGQEAGIAPSALVDTIRQGNALVEHDEWLAGRFDAVLTNPPYVNIRRIASQGEMRQAYRRRYRCARGAFDLYVLFLERSIESLRAGGRLGAIVPNKLATLDYARGCREILLTEGTIETIADLSALRVFQGAGVYPYVVVWTKRTAAADHRIRVVRPHGISSIGATGAGGEQASESFVLQLRQEAARGLMLGGDLPLESRVPTTPLGEVCTIRSGATGFEAEALAGRLVDGASLGDESFEFVTSGNIDPYAIRLGDVRFMGRRLARPRLSAADPALTENKRRLYASRKIVLAGMAKRLEAALDELGLALGVQVYAAVDFRIDPLYLLGLLNSRLLSHLFRLRFSAKSLSGGYFTLSKKQLEQLPIRVLDRSSPHERRLHDRLTDQVRRRMTCVAGSAAAAAYDAKIDSLVLALYGVTAGEMSGSLNAA